MIALTILGYWIGLAVFMWIILYSCLSFARLCEHAVDFFFTK
jgi:hypothetical protein